VRVRRPRIRGTRQTLRSPTHSHHCAVVGRYCDRHRFGGVRLLHVSSGLRNPIAKFVQRQTHSRHRSPASQSACRTQNHHVWPESSFPFGRRAPCKSRAAACQGKMTCQVSALFAAPKEQAPSPRRVISYSAFRSKKSSHIPASELSLKPMSI